MSEQQSKQEAHARVEIIDPSHVLESMRSLGWEPGKRPPAQARIMAKNHELFGNGGSTNRMGQLVATAVARAMPADAATTPAEAAELVPLPEALATRLADGGAKIDTFLQELGAALGSSLASYRSEIDGDAESRIAGAVKGANEKVEQISEELVAALEAAETTWSNLDKATATIAEVTEALATAREDLAAAAADNKALQAELAKVTADGGMAAVELLKAREDLATATADNKTLQAELAKTTAAGDKATASLATARENLAAAAADNKALQAELTKVTAAAQEASKTAQADLAKAQEDLKAAYADAADLRGRQAGFEEINDKLVAAIGERPAPAA